MSLFRRINRKHWFLCSHCLLATEQDTLRSVFYYDGPGEDFLGRTLTRCPRCLTTDTRSFEEIQREGSGAALWGLERIVKQYPRRRFVVKPAQSPSVQ